MSICYQEEEAEARRNKPARSHLVLDDWARGLQSSRSAGRALVSGERHGERTPVVLRYERPLVGKTQESGRGREDWIGSWLDGL